MGRGPRSAEAEREALARRPEAGGDRGRHRGRLAVGPKSRLYWRRRLTARAILFGD